MPNSAMPRRWRKSSYSSGNPNNCVEVSSTLDAVRDSKNPHGSELHVSSLTALLNAIKTNRFDQ